ncbi:MAG: amidase [Chloroflexota bacterium]
MSGSEALYRLSALQLAQRIKAGTLSPLTLMETTLARIEQTEPTFNAFISRRADLAITEAERSHQDLEDGKYGGWLHGIPLAVKDNISVNGMTTTAGSKVMPEIPASADAESVRRLTEAGAIVVGKTNLHEFAYGATNVNAHWGSVHNPWRPGFVAGGSSGGSAAAVAGGQVPLALGTDAAGSIRMPASVCGIVGLKPTFGRVSAQGLVASHNSTVDHIGPMARDVADAAAALSVLAGFDPDDPLSINQPTRSYEAELEQVVNLRGMRIGVPTNYFFDLMVPEVEQVVRSAIESLGGLGARLTDVEIPDLEDMMPLRLALFADGLAFHTSTLREDPFRYGEDVRTRLLTDHFVLTRDHAQAARVRRLMQQRFADAFRDVDLIVAPTTPTAAVPLDTRTVEVMDRRTGQTVQHDLGLLMLRLTAPANLTGLPAISLPCGFTPDGLPVGLQFIARPFAEHTLLAAAYAYEQTAGWSSLRQPLVW